MGDSRGIHTIADGGNLMITSNSRDLYGLGVFRRPSRLSTSANLRDIPTGHFVAWRTVPRSSNEPRDGGTELNGLLHRAGVLHWTMKAGDLENENDYPTQGFLDSGGPHGLFRIAHAHHNKVGGYLAECPADLGGDYLCGFCGPPDISTASGGPALYVVTDDSSAAPWASLPSVTLLEYGNTKETRLSLFSGTTKIYGCAWIETETARGVVFSVSTGVGEQWYGEAFHIRRNGLPLIDPYEEEHGYHSNRYEQQLWVYNPEDLKKVFRSELSAGQPQPVAVIPLSEYEAINRRNQPVALAYRNGRLTVTLANGYLGPFHSGSGTPLVLEFGF